MSLACLGSRKNSELRKQISINSLQRIVSTSWENSAVAHIILFEKIIGEKVKIQFNRPNINLSHLKKMTTDTGIIQFSKINMPELKTGYKLDENARALLTLCMYFKLTGNEKWLPDIRKYLNFIKFCQPSDGTFLNYIDKNKQFTNQNNSENLDDSNGRAIWALGYIFSLNDILPQKIIDEAEILFKKSLNGIEKVHSTRRMFRRIGRYPY